MFATCTKDHVCWLSFVGLILAPQLLQGKDRRILIAVIPGDEGNHGPRRGATNGGDGNLGAGVECGGNLDDSGIDLGDGAGSEVSAIVTL